MSLLIASCAYAEEPLPAVEKRFCVADPMVTSAPDSGTGIFASFAAAEIDTDVVPEIAGTLRARAQGGAQSRTARIFAGYRLTPELSFPATFTNELRITGYLRDASNPPARVRVNMRVIDVETGDVIASAQPQPFAEENPPNSGGGITESFTDVATQVSISLDLIANRTIDVQYELRVRSAAAGSLSDVNFATDGRGVTLGCLTVTPDLVDTDMDGLFDQWEVSGIDVDGEGDSPDFDPAALGVDFRGVPIVLDPMRKDILVEIDYFNCVTPGGDCSAGSLHTHAPRTDALQAVVDSFANATEVTNPDISTGINLWIIVDQALPHMDACALGDCFDGLKSRYLGTDNAVDPAAPDVSDTSAHIARQMVFHYALFIHDKSTDTNSTGQSDGGCDRGTVPAGEPKTGDDFVVSLGDRDIGGRSFAQQGGTFMHELGHNLGLCHGGFEEVNCKPNYQSVMSYAYQMGGIPPFGRIDYSHERLDNLDTTALDEFAGINANNSDWVWFGPRRDLDGDGSADDLLVGRANAAINWNWNFDPDGTPTVENGVSAKINDFGFTRCPQSDDPTTFVGFNDWENIDLNFRNSRFYPSGHGVVDDDEMTAEDAASVMDSTFWALFRPKYDYTAKVICGLQKASDDFRLAPGHYASVINIMNLGPEPAAFDKDLLLAFPPAAQVAGERYDIAIDHLEVGRALEVDCNDITSRLFANGGPGDAGYYEGFITLASNQPLAVTGVYTVASIDAEGSLIGGAAIDLEQIEGTRRTRFPDLSISKSAQVTGSGITSRVDYTIMVENIGEAPALGAMVIDTLEVSEADIVNLTPGDDFMIVSQSTSAAQLQAQLEPIQPGSNVVLEYQVFTQSAGGNRNTSLTNTASAELDADPVAVNDTVTLITSSGD